MRHCITTSAIVLAAMLLIVTLFSSCSDDSTAPKEQVSILPEPQALTPEATLTETGVEVTLNWQCENPDGHSLTYDLYLGITDPPPLLESDLTESSYSFFAAYGDTVYYWSVTARDNNNRTSKSPLWKYFIRAPFQYPLVIGRNWEYTGQFFCFNFQPDTLAGQYGFNLFRNSIVEVMALDTVPSGVQVYRLHETMSEVSESFESDTYFENRKKGLYYHGHSGMSSVAPLKLTADCTFEFRGIRFNSLGNLLHYFFGKIQLFATVLSRGTVYHDPPLKSLQYPMVVGSQWNFRESNDPWLIDKQIVSEGLVEVPAGSFHAYKVLWLYDIDEDGEYDEDISLWDQISYDGLISRTAVIKGIAIIDYSGGIIGTMDINDNWELTDLR